MTGQPDEGIGAQRRSNIWMDAAPIIGGAFASFAILPIGRLLGAMLRLTYAVLKYAVARACLSHNLSLSRIGVLGRHPFMKILEAALWACMRRIPMCTAPAAALTAS
jgi:hypothetical protein